MRDDHIQNEMPVFNLNRFDSSDQRGISQNLHLRASGAGAVLALSRVDAHIELEAGPL